jgi:hypothetical membrane protein
MPIRRPVFTIARRAIGVATLLALVAIARYPGGTMLDHSSPGYSFFHNFLSDLGMTVAHGGQPNALGSILFILSLCILVVAVGGCLVGLVRLYSDPPRARAFARAAGVVGLLVCASFIGVAVTPENRMLGLHMKFTLFAFRAFPAVSLLLVFASLYSDLFPRRVAVAWALLTVLLATYVGVLTWGPALTTPEGLTIQVTAQKVIAIVAVSTFVYLSFEADRAVGTLARSSLRSRPPR